jgi:hypothetical protein
METQMPIWATAPVIDSPTLVLIIYRILETDKGDRHFVGYNLSDREGRVSTPIDNFDLATLTGRTRSGRTYQLRDRPGVDADAMYVWQDWCRVNGVQSWVDVTSKVLAGQ